MDKLGNRVHITLPPEDDEGNVEYKWNLATVNKYKLNKLTSQMRWRVHEASDSKSALYIIGVHDKGQLSGLTLSDLKLTYLTLINCASKVELYTCLRVFKELGTTKRYWGILQVFDHSVPKKEIHMDYDLPVIPDHKLPDYITDLF